MAISAFKVGTSSVSIPRRELEKLSGKYAAARTTGPSTVSIPRRELEKLSEEEVKKMKKTHTEFPFPGGN